MFERFAEAARHVVVLAQEEARALRHNYIGTEHILLGLIAENEGAAVRTHPTPGSEHEEQGGVAVRILDDLDADAERFATR